MGGPVELQGALLATEKSLSGSCPGLRAVEGPCSSPAAWGSGSQRPRGGHPRTHGRLPGSCAASPDRLRAPNAGGGARGVFRPRGRGSASLPLATCQHSATSPEGPGLPASLDPPPGSGSFGHMTPLSLARLGLTPPTRLPWGACLSGSGRRSQERAATCRGCRERAPGRWGTAGKRAGGGFCRLNAELIAQCLGRRGTLP